MSDPKAGQLCSGLNFLASADGFRNMIKTHSPRSTR